MEGGREGERGREEGRDLVGKLEAKEAAGGSIGDRLIKSTHLLRQTPPRLTDPLTEKRKSLSIISAYVQQNTRSQYVHAESVWALYF